MDQLATINDPDLILAGQIVDDLTTSLRDGETSLECVPLLVGRVLADDLWRRRQIRTGQIVTFEKFADFVTAPPLAGLGERSDRIKRLLDKDEDVLQRFEAAIRLNTSGTRTDLDSNTTKVASVDRGKAYTLRRLAKDHPELYAKVCQKELSANAAAIEAGFRKLPTPLELLLRAWEKADESARREFLALVGR